MTIYYLAVSQLLLNFNLSLHYWTIIHFYSVLYRSIASAGFVGVPQSWIVTKTMSRLPQPQPQLPSAAQLKETTGTKLYSVEAAAIPSHSNNQAQLPILYQYQGLTNPNHLLTQLNLPILAIFLDSLSKNIVRTHYFL